MSPTPTARMIFRFAFTLVGICATVIASTLRELSAYFGVGAGMEGVFTAAFFIGASLAIFGGGLLLDRLVSRPISVGGAALAGGGLFLLALLPAELPLIGFISVLAFGLGYGLLVVAGNTLAPKYNPQNPARELSAVNFFFGVGAVIGPQIANFAISQDPADSFRLTYWLVGVASIVIAGVFAFMPNFTPITRTDHASKISWMRLIPFAVLLFVYVGVEMGFSAWIKPQLILVAQSDEGIGALGISLFWAGLTLGRFITSFIAGRVSGELLLLLGIGAVGAGVLGVLVFASQEMLLLALSFIVGFGCAPIFPIGLAIINQRYPQGFGTISGVIIAIGNSGAIFLPAIQGVVGAGNDGGMLIPFIGAGVMFLCAVLVMRMPQATPEAV